MDVVAAGHWFSGGSITQSLDKLEGKAYRAAGRMARTLAQFVPSGTKT